MEYLQSFQSGINWLIQFNLLPLSIIFSITLFCLLLLRKFWVFIELLKKEAVFLELTPPASTEKTAYTTQQLFSVLHNIGSQRTIVDKLLGRKVIFSFEIVSTKEQGIRYIVKTTTDEANIVQRNILAYLPHVRVKQVSEYLSEKLNQNFTEIIEFGLRKHYAFPLAKQNLLEEHDPVAYITGMMTKLSPGELISFQIIVSPTKTREANDLSRKILNNEDVLRLLDTFQLPDFLTPFALFLKAILNIMQKLSQEAIWAVNEILHGTSTQYANMQISSLNQKQLQVNHLKPARVISAFEQEVVESIQEKISQSLFQTSIRVLIAMKNIKDIKQRVRGIKSSLAPFSVPNYQSIYTKRALPFSPVEQLKFFLFRKRLLTLFFDNSSSLLSVSEIADIYHFPFSQVTQTENIVKIHSKELPAPLSLKKDSAGLDIVFAKNTYGGSTTKIGLNVQYLIY